MPHFYRQAQAALAKQQRKLSKKRGFRKGERRSGRYLKQLRTVQKLQEHVANQRSDFLHKLSAQIANECDVVAVEDLNMQAMSRSLNLGKATMDNGYGEFVRQLEYKFLWQGKRLIRMDKWYPSSQLCSSCGYQNRDTKNLGIRSWTCPVCGTIHDRDLNTALNIRNEGLRILGYS